MTTTGWAMACVAMACLTGPYTVTDGDTFKSREGWNVRVFGVDSPEKSDAARWPIAKAKLAEVLGNQPLACYWMGNTYNRVAFDCFLPTGEALGCALLREGTVVQVQFFTKGRFDSCQLRPEPRPNP